MRIGHGHGSVNFCLVTCLINEPGSPGLCALSPRPSPCPCVPSISLMARSNEYYDDDMGEPDNGDGKGGDVRKMEMGVMRMAIATKMISSEGFDINNFTGTELVTSDDDDVSPFPLPLPWVFTSNPQSFFAPEAEDEDDPLCSGDDGNDADDEEEGDDEDSSSIPPPATSLSVLTVAKVFDGLGLVG